MTDDNVIDLPKKEDEKLWMCLVCHERWHSVNPVCPKCTSTSFVFEDKVHIVPSTHVVYACQCNDSVHFKIAKHPRHGIYFKCVLCGKNHWPKDIGLK